MGVGIPLRPNPRHNDYPLHEHHDRRSDDRQRRSAGDDFQDWLRLHHSLGRKVGAVGLPAFGTVRIGGSARRGVADDRRRHRKGDGVIDPQRAPVLEGNLAALQRTKLSQCLSRLWAAALPTGPRSAAALLSLRVQRYGRLHRGDTDSATNKHRSLSSQIVSAAAFGLPPCRYAYPQPRPTRTVAKPPPCALILYLPFENIESLKTWRYLALINAPI